jgi:nucleoside-diphosphate-sugar epimerase
MKIFITGSSGYVGSELVNHLSKKYNIKKYDLIDGQDILDFTQLKKTMKGCDIVVHLAAIRGPDKTKNFQDYFKVNCQGTFNLAQACLENNIKKIIYASSTGYYGAEVGIPYVKPIRESNQVISQHVKIADLDCRDCDIGYSTSKVIAEQILANYGLTKKMQVIMLRLGPIGGKPGEKWILDGITLKIENAIQALELAISTNKELWYEAITITDNIRQVDISKAKRILNYKPI